LAERGLRDSTEISIGSDHIARATRARRLVMCVVETSHPGTLRRYARLIYDVAQLALCTSKALALLKRLALASPFREAL